MRYWFAIIATLFCLQPIVVSAATAQTTVKAPTQGTVPAPTVTASSYVIIDETSGQELAAKNADKVWPVASISKLMTAQVAIADGLSMTRRVKMVKGDYVGGAALATKVGTTFTVADLFTAMLMGSANNAATAIARAANGSQFVAQMNARAKELHLTHTHFNDPSGMDPGNVSTAREVAIFAEAAFALDPVRTRATSAQRIIYATSNGEKHTIKNTDWMLTKHAYDDVYVTSGKTGFLDESGWNFVVRMRPSKNAKSKELLIVVFGANSRADSFNDAQKLGEWVWKSFTYPK